MDQVSSSGTLVPQGGEHAPDLTHMLADEPTATEAEASSMGRGQGTPHTSRAGSALASIRDRLRFTFSFFLSF